MSSTELSAGRVLIVEDEVRIADVLVRALGRDGREVVVAEDGHVGLFLASTEPFDVVVLDLGLPGRSGLDVLRDIRAVRKDLPVVMLTGRDEPEARATCLAAGATGFVTKPFVVAELRAEVGRHLPAA